MRMNKMSLKSVVFNPEGQAIVRRGQSSGGSGNRNKVFPFFPYSDFLQLWEKGESCPHLPAADMGVTSFSNLPPRVPHSALGSRGDLASIFKKRPYFNSANGLENTAAFHPQCVTQ